MSLQEKKQRGTGMYLHRISKYDRVTEIDDRSTEFSVTLRDDLNMLGMTTSIAVLTYCGSHRQRKRSLGGAPDLFIRPTFRWQVVGALTAWIELLPDEVGRVSRI